MTETAIPFIGDTFSPTEKIFKGTCITGDLFVTNFKYEDTFEIEMNLCSMLDSEQQDENIHVVIGVDIELLTEEDVKLQGSILANVRGGKKFTREVPVNVVCGKVKIVQYKLFPIDLLSILAMNITDTEAKNEDDVQNNPKFDPRKIAKIKIFQDLNGCLREADEISNNANNKSVLTADERNILKLLKTALFECKENFFLDCFNYTQEINSCNWVNKIHTLMMRIENCRILTKSRSDYLKNLQSVHTEKLNFIQRFKDVGLVYISDIETFNSLLKTENCFVLFYTDELVKTDPINFECVLDFLNNFIEKNVKLGEDQMFLAVNSDVILKDEMHYPLPEKVTVFHFSKQNLISADLINDIERKKNLNLAKCTKQGQGEELRRRGKFVMPCPNSGKCLTTFREWICNDCEEPFDYGFNDRLYCKCANGKGIPIKDFEFRCSDPNHGFYYLKFNKVCAEYLKKIDPSEHTLENFSILTIGLEGNKKTDWINDVINYISFEDFEAAKKRRIIAAEPGTVCQTYNVRYKYGNIRLIDTPDLGGTVNEIGTNIKCIVEYISEVNDLHGVCILLKPMDLDLDLTTKYCLKELLSRLHRNCAANVFFIFQNSKAPFYPDDKYPALKKLLEEFQESIPITEDKIYCFDDELNRYFGNTLKNHVEKDDFKLNWAESVWETKRLLDHVISLPPHATLETKTLNENRDIILKLVIPMDHVIRTFETSLSTLSYLEIIRENCTALTELLQKHSNNYTLDTIRSRDPFQKYPENICSAQCCVQFSANCGNNQLVSYKSCRSMTARSRSTNCFNNCTLPECLAYQRETFKNVCLGKTHVTVNCGSKQTGIKFCDQFLNMSIDGNLDQKGAGSVNLRNQITDLSNEKRRIIETVGKFTYFLKEQAIVGYNNCFSDCLNCTLLKNDADYKEKEMKFFDMGRVNILEHGEYETSNFDTLIKELYDIPVFGKKFEAYLKALDLKEQAEKLDLANFGLGLR